MAAHDALRRAAFGAASVAALLAITTLSVAWAAAPRDASERVVDPAAGTADQVVQQALLAAIDPNAAAGFERYLGLLHPRIKDSPDAIEQLRRYSWKRFRDQAQDYIVAGTTGGYVLTRRDPPRVTDLTTHVRLFVKAVNNPRRTFPTPIRLERAGDRWLITANSL